MRRALVGLALALSLLPASTSEYASAKRKLESIESDKLKPGSRVSLSAAELHAYGIEEARKKAPEGVRDSRLELMPGSATAYATVDFAKLQEGRGQTPGWLMGKLLSGERPVKVVAQIRSREGKATVEVASVDVSGMTIDGRMLDFLISRFLLPMFPNAKVGKPFELGHNIDRLEVKTGAAVVVIGSRDDSKN